MTCVENVVGAISRDGGSLIILKKELDESEPWNGLFVISQHSRILLVRPRCPWCSTPRNQQEWRAPRFVRGSVRAPQEDEQEEAQECERRHRAVGNRGTQRQTLLRDPGT